jgi:hypothetical protein
MVSSKYSGDSGPLSASRMAPLPNRGDAIGAALRSMGCVSDAIPDDMMRLLEKLDTVPDRFSGRG